MKRSQLPQRSASTEGIFKMNALRSVLLRRGITHDRLAAEIGLTARSLSNQISNGFQTLSARRRLENHLRLPIWASFEEFVKRQELIAQIGCDPVVSLRGELRDCAKRLGVPLNPMPSTKKADLKEILKFIKRSNKPVNPKPTQP